MSNVKKIREKQTESSCFNILQLKNVLHKLEILKCVKLKKSKPKKKNTKWKKPPPGYKYTLKKAMHANFWKCGDTCIYKRGKFITRKLQKRSLFHRCQ